MDLRQALEAVLRPRRGYRERSAAEKRAALVTAALVVDAVYAFLRWGNAS